MMDQKSLEMIRDIKLSVVAMLEERHRLSNETESSLSLPSDLWSEACSFFDYMLGLADESYAKLRLHTYHLTGDSYPLYFHGRGKSRFQIAWAELVRNIPCELRLSEPEGGIGYRLDDGRMISGDILRYQYVVNTLYRQGIVPRLAKENQGPIRVLEIGAGYGGLAHHLSNILGNAVFYIVDLPETLLFSASYLTLNNPDKRTYIYKARDFSSIVGPHSVSPYDFVLVPNYKLDYLRDLQFDLVINVASFQEMRSNQVETYLDFVAETCKGAFYTWNKDAHQQNRELGNLTKMLRARFELTEVTTKWPPTVTQARTWKQKVRLKIKSVLKMVAVLLGLADPPVKDRNHGASENHEYICKTLENYSGLKLVHLRTPPVEDARHTGPSTLRTPADSHG